MLPYLGYLVQLHHLTSWGGHQGHQPLLPRTHNEKKLWTHKGSSEDATGRKCTRCRAATDGGAAVLLLPGIEHCIRLKRQRHSGAPAANCCGPAVGLGRDTLAECHTSGALPYIERASVLMGKWLALRPGRSEAWHAQTN